MANYHSRTDKYNTIYRADLMRKATKWADWLEARFVTLDVNQTDPVPTMPAKLVSHQAIQTPAKKLPATKPVTVQTAKFTGYVPRQISFITKSKSFK